MDATKWIYKRKFDRRVRIPQKELQTDHTATDDMKCVIGRETYLTQERISLDRVALESS